MSAPVRRSAALFDMNFCFLSPLNKIHHLIVSSLQAIIPRLGSIDYTARSTTFPMPWVDRVEENHATCFRYLKVLSFFSRVVDDFHTRRSSVAHFYFLTPPPRKKIIIIDKEREGSFLSPTNSVSLLNKSWTNWLLKMCLTGPIHYIFLV